MSTTTHTHRFALDQNFPTPLLEALRPFIREVDLVSVRDLDGRLPELRDWELLLSLYHWRPRIDGLVTADSSMTSLPREMCVVAQTRLSLIVAAEAGHDPLKAAGLLLLHLPHICEQSRIDRAQIWSLRSIQRPPVKPHEYLERIAKRERKTVEEVRDEHALSQAELALNPLG